MNVAALLHAALRAADYPNNAPEWAAAHRERVDYAIKNWLPSGSGFDSPPTVEAAENKLTITAPFHHMNEGGFYDGWLTYKIVLTPAFDGFNIRITCGGDDRADKDYVADTYLHALAAVPTMEQLVPYYSIKP